MALSVKIQTGIILIWIFILSAGVSSYENDCWSFLCVTDSSLNCTCKPEVPNWVVPTICLVPLIMIGTCFIRMCIHYYNTRDAIPLPDRSSLPNPSSEMISAQNFQLRIPPSYNEAVTKLPRYLAPLDPPAYEDIDMHYVTPSDDSVLPMFMPRNITSTV